MWLQGNHICFVEQTRCRLIAAIHILLNCIASGVYTYVSPVKTRTAGSPIVSVKRKPVFRDFPCCFLICPYFSFIFSKVPVRLLLVCFFWFCLFYGQSVGFLFSFLLLLTKTALSKRLFVFVSCLLSVTCFIVESGFFRDSWVRTVLEWMHQTRRCWVLRHGVTFAISHTLAVANVSLEYDHLVRGLYL